MKNTLTASIATISTAVPEITQNFDPTVITEGTSLVVQVVTGVIAIISFVRSLLIKKTK